MKKVGSEEIRRTLNVNLSDLWWATLDDHCGNEGYIGLTPDRSSYHVVVPVDRQIARGIKACNQPTDGTPFGGYRRWYYFPCETYEPAGTPVEEKLNRTEKALENGRLLRIWAASLHIEVEIHFNLD